jgi:hypothetical protein
LLHLCIRPSWVVKTEKHKTGLKTLKWYINY